MNTPLTVQPLRGILVLVDSRAMVGNKALTRSLDRVTRLAMEHGATLTFADVVEALPPDVQSDDLAARLTSLREAFARDFLHSLVAPIETLVPMSVEVWRGIPFVVVTHQVIERGFDLVVRITSRRPGTGPDADDMHLVRKCPCPIWIVNAAVDSSFRNIAVAVDRDIFSSDGAASGFAKQLSRTALMFANLEHAHLHIAHAWEPYGAELLANPALDMDEASIAQYVDRQRSSHEAWLTELRDEVAEAGACFGVGTAVEAHLLDGKPEAAIPEFLDAINVELLIMGTVGVSTIQGMFIGNTAERILDGMSRSVLAIKPPTFVSPMSPARSAEHGSASSENERTVVESVS